MSKEGQPKNFIALPEATKNSGYTRDYLGQLIRQKKIYGEKFGREWFTTRESLQKHLAAQGRTLEQNLISLKEAVGIFPLNK